MPIKKYTIKDYKKVDVSSYKLREVSRRTANNLHFDYALFFQVAEDDSFYIHTWLSFDEKQKIPFPDFEVVHFYFDAGYVTDEVLKDYEL